ncbi:MAG: MarR family transcriptional regulator [Deltaproteobacteria bacterium]|nr:MarR family transcriptional regulator [Deltaproteobacteria bacterium]
MIEKSQQIAEIIDNLRRVFQVVHSHSKKAERETGLTGPQLWTIKVIAEAGSIRVSDLARRIYLHPATTVGILDRLEKKGLVSRTRSEEDKRVVYVGLTRLGCDSVKKSPHVAQGLLVAGLEQLSPLDLKIIDDGLEKMVSILGAQELPPQLLLSPEVNQAGEPLKARGARKKKVSS